MTWQPAAFAIACPFCATPTASSRCERCARDPRSPRRICTRCQRPTPTTERVCMHCGAAKPNDLSWKVPLIILLFVLAFALSVAVAAHR
jgi:hypothetical protein